MCFGMMFSEEGMTADSEMAKVIQDWPSPRRVRDVKSFLQTVQFNSIYMAVEEAGEPNYPKFMEPLRALTRQGKKFTWTEVHEENFHAIKERLCSDRLLVPLDPYRDTRLYSDGGSKGCKPGPGVDEAHTTT